MKEQEKISQTELENRQTAADFPKTIKCRFPDLFPSFSGLPDPRKPQGKQYGMGEIVTGGLSIFLFKEGSRNQLNNNRSDGYFSEHYQQMFGMNLPHQDAVNDVLCALRRAFGTSQNEFDEQVV